MATLLHLDASPLGDLSLSRTLSAEYARLWQARNPGGRIIRRDLSADPIPPIDAAWVMAVSTPAAERSEEQRAKIALSDVLLAELRAADEYAIGAPMYNFAIASTMKLWIDQIVRADETFRYGENGPIGLLEQKSAIFLASSGGVYGPGGAPAEMNFVEPYLRTIFRFIGVQNIDFITADGAVAVRHGKIERSAFLAPHLTAIHARFAETAATA